MTEVFKMSCICLVGSIEFELSTIYGGRVLSCCNVLFLYFSSLYIKWPSEVPCWPALMQDNMKGYKGKRMMSAGRDYHLSGCKKVIMYPGCMW